MKRPKRLFRRRGIRPCVLRPDQISVTREADAIVARAMASEARIVSLVPLVFFSTATGDAWILDGDNSLALPLALEGIQQPFRIEETSRRVAIEWTGTFQIERDVMIYHDMTGASRGILGYPTNAILTAICLRVPITTRCPGGRGSVRAWKNAGKTGLGRSLALPIPAKL